MKILLTGATTLVGAEILKELLLRPNVEAIFLLMPIEESARRRDLEHLETYLGSRPPSITAVAGDLRLPNFGLTLASWKELTASLDIGFQCYQREVKDQNLELARQTNLRPTETWIQMLSNNPKLRLHHLSTAFIGGTRCGLLTEFDLDCGQGFHDAWERSNFEAEVRLRGSHASDRVTIYRPSHILGRAATGEAFCHGGSYPLLATLAAGTVLLGDPRSRIDFVPADYVAASMVALACLGASGTFHLACGWESSLPVRQAALLAAKGRGRSRAARLLPRGIAWPLRFAGAATLGGLASRSLAFTTARDLLHQGPVFDTYRANLALLPLGIACPAPENWLEGAVRHAEAHRWESPPPYEFERTVADSVLPTAAVEVALIREDLIFSEKRFQQVGKVNVAYRDVGEGDPIVFLHGLAGAHAWDGVIQHLAARHRTLVVETFGFGDTEEPSSADFGLQEQAAMVRGLLSSLEIPAAHIVGNDTGGVIAQFFAVRWPSCVKSLVLSDCHSHSTRPPTHLAWMKALTGLPGGTLTLAALLKIPAVARSRIGFGRMVHDKRLLTRERLRQYRDTVAGNRERRMRLKRFFRSFDQEDLANINHLLGQLEVPTMIIWGADDTCYSPSWAKTLYDKILGTRKLELIPFAGMSCHEERPDLFAGLLARFLGEIDAEASPSVQGPDERRREPVNNEKVKV